VTTALEIAGRDGRDVAAPEDLLQAIAADPESAAVFIFEHAGIAPEKILRRLEDDNQCRPERSAGQHSPSELPQRATALSPAAMHLLDIAKGEADRLAHRHIGTEHVALALARSNTVAASQILHDLGLTLQRGEAALRAWTSQGMRRQRNRLERWAATTPVRWLVGPIRFIGHYPALMWKVLVRKSIGHPGFVSDPYPLYRKLRERQPVRKDPIAPVWIITSYDETLATLRDPRFKKDPFASQRLPETVREQLQMSIGESFRGSVETTSMLFLDPPEHTRVRAIFTRTFTPRRLESLRPRIEQICEKWLDRIEQRGRMELMGDLAAPLPVTVIAELLGFPPEDYQQIKEWSDDMAEALGLNPSMEAQTRAALARAELRVYFDQVVQRIEQQPGDNLLSALLAPEVDVMTREELFANSVLLLAAGHETTTNLIGNGMLALLRHPDQLAALRADPQLMGSAIEEMLRYDPPVQWTSRVAGEEIELAGVTIPRGQIVLASLGAANRDPKYFEDPDRFDIHRENNKHLSFGSGIHFCLGAALARMEAEITFTAMLRRFPKLRLARQKIRWRKGITFRGVEALELETR